MSSQLLVFGASGISGLAVIQEALAYPSPNTFTKIIGLTNRPLNTADAQLPTDARLEFYSGFDLTKGEAHIISKLQSIPSISATTHVAFLSYIPPTSLSYDASVVAEVKRANVSILQTAITSIEGLAPSLEHFTIQTGGKAYGAEYLATGEIPWSPPLKESAPRVPEPYASRIFNLAQIDAVAALSVGKKWQWTDIRPDAVIGFVPNGNAMDLVGGLAAWLSLYRWVHGEGAEVVFPGNEVVWGSKHTDTSQQILGKSHLYALVSGKASGKAVNVGDGTTSWSEGLWADICAWFGLKGVGPQEGVVTGEQWVFSQKGRWAEYEAATGLKEGTVKRAASGLWFMSVLLVRAAIDRHYDLGLSGELGFPQSRDTTEGYCVAFERLRRARLIQ
jgi:nucleoside-diphosphate-sugar epimerase